MRIVIFSDLHIFTYSLDCNTIFTKQYFGILRKRFFDYYYDNFDFICKMITKIISLSPDIVLFTGDFTNTGAVLEFVKVRELLEPLVNNKNFIFYCVPGNHDLYINNKACMYELSKTLKYLNHDQIDIKDYPHLCTLNGIEFCLVNECYPRPFYLSNGIIDDYNIKFIQKWALINYNMPKVLIGHYPLTENKTWKFWRLLIGYESILKLLENKFIDLSICGHKHISCDKLNLYGRGEVIVGALPLEHNLTMIDYNRDKDKFIYNIVKI